MRQKVFTSFILLVFIIMISACEKEESNLETKVKLLTQTEIEEIGIKHNEALASVLAELQKHPDLNGEQKTMKASMATKKFLRTIYPENNQVIAAANEEEYRVYKRFTNSKVKSAVSPIISTLDENEEFFSEKQKKLLQECDNILSGEGLNLEEILEGLNEIQKKAKELKVGEQSVIMAAAEVGKQSAIYWNKNLVTWDEALNGIDDKRTKGWFNFGDVVKADVTGAVAGAVGAAVLNALPGPGTVAYGGAILAGAATGSTASAVSQILDHCFYPAEGSHISYFTNDPIFLRFASIKDISKIETVEGRIVDFNKVQLYIDAYGNIPYLASLKEVKLFAYEKQAYSKSHFINVPLRNFEDKSCAVIRHLVGTTSRDNVGMYPEELDDGGEKDETELDYEG